MQFGRLLYLELRHDGLTGRRVSSDTLMLDTAKNPSEFPADALTAAFGHDRLIIADFQRAQCLLNLVLRQLCSRRDLIKPVVVLRLTHRFASTVTPVEIRALLDALIQAGARRAWVWVGRELADAEIASRRFPDDGIAISDRDLGLRFPKSPPL